MRRRKGGISISENPVFRFAYDDNGSTALTVKATDTEGNSFETALRKVEGVASATSYGLRPRTIEVRANQIALAARMRENRLKIVEHPRQPLAV